MNSLAPVWPILFTLQSAAEINERTAPLAEASNLATQWWIIGAVTVAIPIALIVLSFTSRLGVIAAATFKEAIRQPLFLLLLAVSIVLLIVLTFLPYFSFGEDVKMLKDCGHLTLLFCGLLLAAWTASTSIADEIEGKTAMTLLSKPINRRQFVLGKYLGILEASWLLVAIGGVVFLFLIYYKVGYDMKEASSPPPDMYVLQEVSGLGRIPLPEPQRFVSALQAVPGLLLIALEVSVLAAISVAISTRLPMIFNLTACFAIFIVGHLTPVMVQSDISGPGMAVVRFVALLIATVLPMLDAFNMQVVVAMDRFVPPVYLGYCALYCLAYVTAAILLAFILFEDRDLA